MIVGINGKIHSGKDTVAKIWTLLALGCYPDDIECILTEAITYPKSGVGYPLWETKRFADKLKETIALWLGVPRSLLEDDKFKDSLLEEEWQVYTILHNSHNIGEPIYFSTKEEAIEYCVKSRKRYPAVAYKRSIRTVRWLLQHIGTQLFRNRLHENVHVNGLFVDYHEDKKWIVPDMRFPNELERVIRLKGVTIKVKRFFRLRFPEYGHLEEARFPYDIPRALYDVNEGLWHKLVHESETGLDNYTLNYTIENNSTLGNLIVKVNSILIKTQ